MDQPEGQTPPSEVAVPTSSQPKVSDVQSSGEDEEEENPSNTQKQREPSEVGKLGDLDLVFGNIGRRRRNQGPRTPRSSEKLCSAANIYMDADETDAAEALLKLENDLQRNVVMIPENFMFEQVVQVDTTGSYMIVVPQEIAMQHQIIDENSVEGIILVLNNRECKACPVLINYPQLEIKELFGSLFWVHNNLAPNDMVQFYKPIEPQHNRQYVVDCYKFLSKKKLNGAEATHSQLHIPRQDLKKFAIGTTDEDVTRRAIVMFDNEGTSWEMELVIYNASGAIKITGKWKAFCVARNLKADDGVRIYKSNVEDKYLIRIDRAARD